MDEKVNIITMIYFQGSLSMVKKDVRGKEMGSMCSVSAMTPPTKN
jgi:hypothetical protein